MRRSELLGLRWPDVDKATVSITRGLVAVGYELCESRGKTVNSRRSIDLDHPTLLIKEGVPVKVVSKRLGHTTTAFTIDTYQHVLLGIPADAAHLFGQLIEPSTGHTRWKTA